MLPTLVLLWQLSASLTQPICAAGLNDFGTYLDGESEWVGPNNPDTCDLTSMPARMSVYETQGRQIKACAEYAFTGDESAIEVYLGVDGSGVEVIGTLACEDYALDVVLEPLFQKWFARMAQMHHLNPDADDRRHFYDYRAYWRDLRDGKIAPGDDEGRLWPDRYRLVGHPDFRK